MKLEPSDEVRVAVTGNAWMGGGIGSVQSAIEDLLEAANSEIQIAVYEMTAGADDFLEKLRTKVARGIKATMVVNRYTEKSPLITKPLEDMMHRFPHFDLLDFRPKQRSEDLHAKILVVDRSMALVGSANLTWKGLVGNHELAVTVVGPTASTIARLVDKLSSDPRSVSLRKETG
jgi:phosphatidylserine/phosphatidylglycerophosphate/cardiolipin synthase-like enzyme